MAQVLLEVFFTGGNLENPGDISGILKFMAQGSDGMIIVGKDGTILETNVCAKIILTGKEDKSLQICNVVELVSQAGRLWYHQMMNTLFSAQEVGSLQTAVTIQPFDGRLLHLDVRMVVLSINGVFCVLISLRDVGEKQGHDRFVKRSEKMYRDTFNMVAIGMTHISSDGVFIRVN